MVDPRVSRIAEKAEANYTCSISVPGPMTEATAFPRLDYDMLFIPRVLEGTFSWVGNTTVPRWVKGDLYHQGR